jgi:cyclopropane fatty-acyl-phospholipid synthase-like methyltransferase
LTDEEITNEEFKKHLGGGAQSWESRGAFQLYFLQEMGLQKESKVLDVGCGPGRAGKYLIQFLDESNYFGVDYNANFIKAAYAMSENNKLTVKKPVFQVIQGFDLAHFDPIFDYAMVFSVLNHCNVAQREAFFRMISKPLKKKAKYISLMHFGLICLIQGKQT